MYSFHLYESSLTVWSTEADLGIVLGLDDSDSVGQGDLTQTLVTPRWTQTPTLNLRLKFSDY